MHLSNERSNSNVWPCSGWNGCVTVKTWECASRGAMGGLRQRLRGTRHRSIRRECLDHVIIMNEVELRPCSGTTSRTTIEVARTQPRSWDSGAASGRVTAPPVDDPRGPRHRHATRRDAGASVRGRRLEAEMITLRGASTKSRHAPRRRHRHRSAARRARVAPTLTAPASAKARMSRC